MKTVIAILMAAVLVTGGALAWHWSRNAGAQPSELTVYFSGDTQGRLVPCGCFTGQNGGLTRLATWLQRNATERDIKLDIGDAIAGAEDFQRIQYGYILQAYAQMNFDAMNVGQREAALSLDQMRQIKTTSPVTLLCANVFDASSGQLVFEPYKVLRRGAARIAVVGVVDSHLISETLGAGLRVDPMNTVLEQLLPRLKKNSDAIILLAFTDEDGLARLADQFYELNLILGGKVSQPSQKLLRQNRSAILYTANESRTVGALRAQIFPKFEARSFDMVMLSENIPQADGIIRLATQYRQQIRTNRLDIDNLKRLEGDLVPGIRNRASYVGSDACLECHKEAGQVWEKSQHAHAFLSLVQKGADADPDCISCHTVGFGTASGYRREFHGEKLVNVGCETCHGPGSLHVLERSTGSKPEFKFRPLGAGDCTQCHHGEFSRPFDWSTFWPKIQHRLDTRPAAAAR